MLKSRCDYTSGTDSGDTPCKKKIVKELSNLDASGSASSASALVASTSTGAAVNSGQGSFTTSNYDDRQTATVT